MIHRICALLFLVMLLCPFGAAFSADEMIQFRRGQTSGGVSGQVVKFNKTYQFRARNGQKLTVALEPVGGDKGMLTFSLYAYCGEEFGKPLAIDALRWQGALPCTERYSIDVTPSAEAIKQERPQRYTLTLTIL